MIINKKEPVVLTDDITEEILEVIHEAYVNVDRHNQESTKAVEKIDKELQQVDKELNKL